MADCGVNMKLSPKHIEILNLYCGDAIGCKQGELAERAGVSPRTVQRVFAEPEAHEIIRRLTDHRINMYRPAILNAMAKQAIDGCVASQRNYCQVTGDIGTGGQTNITKVITNTDKDEPLDDAIAREQLDRRTAALHKQE